MPFLEFVGCWQRIERAEAHRKAFAEAWNSFCDDVPYSPNLHIEDDGTGSISIIPRYDSLPVAFALDLGEFLYQLRAALDGAVYGAAIRESGQNPPPDEKRLEFPVCSSVDELTDAIRYRKI